MKKVYQNKWLSFYTGIDRTCFVISPASYDDDRAHIRISPTILIPLIGIFFTGFSLWSLIWILFLPFGYGKLYIDLPIHYPDVDDTDPPQYGFYFYGHNSTFHLTAFVWCWKMKTKHFYMPWDWIWVRTSILKKDGTWQEDTKKNRFDFYSKEWEEQVWQEEYPFTYVLKKGTIQERIATVKVEEREWRWKILYWLPFPRMIRKTIDIDFSYGGAFEREILFEKKGFPIKNLEKYTGEVGERTGSWKGGTLGCGYSMLPGETPLQTLRRMEKERDF